LHDGLGQFLLGIALKTKMLEDVLTREKSTEAASAREVVCLVNTAIAVAADPVRMAAAFRAAIEAGRAAYEVGLAPKRREAEASSPLTGFLNEP